MNESYFDNLSDVELRQELRNYGFPILPITETTRNLLIKKLKHHVLSTANISHKPHSRRSFQPSTSKRRNASPGRRRTQSFSRNVGNITYNSETETSDLKSETFPEHKAFYLSDEGIPYLHKDFSIRNPNDRNSSSPKITRHKSDVPTKKCSPKIYLPPPILVNDVHYSPSPRIEAPRSIRDLDRSPLHSGRESSGVVSRLLKLRDMSIRGTLSSTPLAPKNKLYLSDSDSDSSSPTRYSMAKKRYNRSLPDIIWNKLNVKGNFKQSSVPYLLIGCLGLFFIVLSILYMTKPPDMPSTMLEKSTSFTLCEELTQMASLARPSINCINNDLIPASLTLCKELIQLLQMNTEMHYCNKDKDISAEVHGTDFIKHLYKKHSSDGHKLVKSFHAAVYLIEQNPQWKIQILNKSDNTQLMDIYRQDVRFILLKPYLPWKCILVNKMQRFFFIIGTIFLIALTLGVSFVIWRFINQRSLMKIKLVENFCREINKELIHKSALKNDTNGGEVIINHLRDKLIPLSKRKSLLRPWNDAIHKLEASDSRIQFGTTIQNGEEFRTMKWVESNQPTQSPALSNHERYDNKPQKKHWQSPAFDNVNKILDPPTNCLKIRHMFDAAEANHPDLKQSVIESILEKVGPQCHIYDIQLDRQNCCVYIRCASEKDAGIIHNEINGWWFDNRLVSIKFLRLQRFLTRFPSSTSTTTLTIKNSK